MRSTTISTVAIHSAMLGVRSITFYNQYITVGCGSIAFLDLRTLTPLGIF